MAVVCSSESPAVHQIGDLDSGAYEQLDFEDENTAIYSPKACSGGHFSKDYAGTKRKNEGVLRSRDHSSGVEEGTDEGELKSEDESDPRGSDCSEEGEILSELEELEVTVGQSPVKEETPWERGLRLARERLEKTKALKAAEKDLAEKRMTLAVPASAVEEELVRPPRENVFWPSYYQASIVGRTELTSSRFLPEDLQPPTATELAEWRLGLSDNHGGRRRQKYRDNNRRASSRSLSSSASTSSRATSRSSSPDTSSIASSLESIAASWKATCAQAMKDYLSSPIRNKSRRGRHYHDRRRSVSVSSGSNSQSSDSLSGSDQSQGRTARRRGYGTANSAAASGNVLARNGRYWHGDTHVTGRSRSGSEQSFASRSRSQSSAQRSRATRDRRYDDHQNQREDEWRESGVSGSPSPVRRRTNIPPLPHEKPVKRPWVAAPGPVTCTLPSADIKAHSGRRSRSSSRSRSGSSPVADEKRFITSWSKSPSSGGDERPGRELTRRTRLPDVVPGSHTNHTRRAVTPSRRRKSRSPFAEDASQKGKSAEQLPDPTSGFDEYVASGHPAAPSTIALEDRNAGNSQDAGQISQIRQDLRESTTTTSSQQTLSAGVLPSASNRPGVRMTLAPRLKASAVDMANLAGGVTRPVGRSFQPSPPRMPRLPFPIPSSIHGHSPTTAGQPHTSATTTLDQEEIRRQAEAAAAVVEARERRRAAAEAARRRRNPNRKKREDLSKIPIRGRPTYRRISFSESSAESDSASRSGSSSKSGSASHSRSASATSEVIIAQHLPDPRDPQPDYYDVQYSHHSHKRKRCEPQLNYGRSGDVNEMFTYGRPTMRTMPEDYSHEDPSSMDRRQFRQKKALDANQRYYPEYQSRGENTSYKNYAAPQPKYPYADYEVGNDLAYSVGVVRPRKSKPVSHNSRRLQTTFEEPVQRYERPDGRRGLSGTLPQISERPGRPRTPHAEDAFDFRSPHAAGPVGRTARHERKRVDDRDLVMLEGASSRKRAMLIEPDVEPSVNVDLHRARSRHRSRGPGVPIDRSEPFESDAGGFAAEQRLRELRERLNLVDDAIAEIKAGSGVGFSDSRR
ncbi:hypothetical protein EG68_02762 [Paragonimus skrjabini miyazakii]|uniref:Serine/arginine repetitive matrix protein 2 n=1 Tax=Paragonimus skrjabini miyazakii TaxID=59628 RepID=A0A8S9YY66_9TREM|nr:hypothetical protein EG68_02762 [Paragonimus skrjabini miyazakii]